jgi:hypothetical protein
MTAKIIQVIYAEEKEGLGKEKDPVKIVRKLYTLEGQLICELDKREELNPKGEVKKSE